MTIYKGFETAKNGTQIPVFASGRTMESRYNPQRDAENLCNTISPDDNIFLVLGIGSGLFISLLTKKFPSAKIIALELYEQDIDFLSQSETIQKLKKNPKVILTNLEQLESLLIQNYLPAKYGNLKIIEQRGWVIENSDKIESIKTILNKTLGIISADYSVQAHFGKIWNSNILQNTLLAEKTSVNFSELTKNEINKTAVVVAAGPTLDKTINLLCDQNEHNKYYVISTDTAAQSLIKKNIIPEVIISIDGQSVSYNHFLNYTSRENNKPVYAFDLCANASAARHIAESDNELLFFCSGHPLASAINLSSENPLPFFFSGAGTVTITAVDFAVAAGFSKILILGADFSYSNGKAYTSGTYLDTLYNKASSRIDEPEQTFSRLMFRTELKKLSSDAKTTQILEAYKYSLEKYFSEKNISFTKENDIYQLDATNALKNETKPTGTKLSLNNFLKNLKKADLSEIEPVLLPYIAWLRNNEKYKNLPYTELVKLALDNIVSYNI